MIIEINNLTTNPINEKLIAKEAEKVLKEEKTAGKIGNEEKINLSIVLLGQTRMRELNKKYRGKNRVTDVLSFGGKDGFWEIVICIREVKKNAKKHNAPFEKELTRVLIHGLLHLLGYDHERSKEEAKKMRKKEEHYLNLLWRKQTS